MRRYLMLLGSSQGGRVLRKSILETHANVCTEALPRCIREWRGPTHRFGWLLILVVRAHILILLLHKLSGVLGNRLEGETTRRCWGWIGAKCWFFCRQIVFDIAIFIIISKFHCCKTGGHRIYLKRLLPNRFSSLGHHASGLQIFARLIHRLQRIINFC